MSVDINFSTHCTLRNQLHKSINCLTLTFSTGAWISMVDAIADAISTTANHTLLML